MQHLPRIMLAAPSSGSGKTMITCGILEAFCRRGLNPASFKCGPDYIDPMFHSRVIGTPSRNLDTFFTDPLITRYLFAKTAKNAGISVLEGVMGFYDGLGGISEKASSYDLAAVTDTPVILVVNARGMSLSVIPLIQGYLNYQKQYGREVIRGVILNQTTKMTCLLLKDEIEKQTGVRVYGYVPRLDDAAVESRHLGLVTPGEIADMKVRLARLGEELEQCLDLDGLIALAQKASDFADEELVLPECVRVCVENQKSSGNIAESDKETSRMDGIVFQEKHDARSEYSGARIAVAQDEAFCFYYQDNLELLELLGATLVPFSPLKDTALPEQIGGLILGGGYPELYARQLSENKSMLQSIRAAIADGLPYLAECGGFMYLHETMEDMDGTAWPMCGCIQGQSYRTKKLGRFGYISLRLNGSEWEEERPRMVSDIKKRKIAQQVSGFLLPDETIRAHEFHYFDSTDPGSAYTAEKPNGKRTWNCMHVTDHSAAGYPHLYYWSNPEFAARFLYRVNYVQRMPAE
ncbi:MAG: cobyrinate a,c-diamide synthase [Lachnospiraceae bacterium]|nr:cobyrinate a,c-diamide synthase [Lachnospiraceae bacterium]